jgi:hypothetical protein
MSRLFQSGFEVFINSGAPASCDQIGAPSGAVTRDTTTPRTGNGCIKYDSVSNAVALVSIGSFPLSSTLFWRGYFRFAAYPAAATSILGPASGTNFGVKITSAGKLQLWGTASQIGSDSAATLSLNVYYRVELKMVINSSGQITDMELQLDGTSVASSTGLSIGTAKNNLAAGWMTTGAGTNKVFYLDDVAFNNATGASNNTWPGPGGLVMLVPTADNAVGTGWTLGTGTAIAGNSGSTAVKNAPPLGVADLAAGSDPKQIRNAASAANSNYDATLQSYTAAGVPAGATVNVVQPWVVTSAPVTTSAKLGNIGVVSNPAITDVALSSSGTAGAFWGGTAAGTFPTGWKWSAGTRTEAPPVTLGTAPVMRITQVTASTRIAMVCFMGMYVDYTPAAVVAAKKARVLSTNVPVMRAAVR